MADEKKKGFLSKIFNAKTITKFVLWTVPIFIGATVGTEIISFIWGHLSPGGQELIAALQVPVLNFLNSSGIDNASSDIAGWIKETFNTTATDFALKKPGEYAQTAKDLASGGFDLDF